MLTLDERISNLDTTLFKSIPSQTFHGDKQSLLLLQSCVRNLDEYVYLEIGSHLGGTIQPFYVDPKCKMLYSIDKRPQSQPDERGRRYFYKGNSTDRMLSNLNNAFPSIPKSKITTFDSDASNVNTHEIVYKPHLCFIDGEHTNKAVFSDFRFCLSVCHPDAVIAFHDTCYIVKGIEKIKKHLSNKSFDFKGVMLSGSVYVILLNKAVQYYSDDIIRLSSDEDKYFITSKENLKEIRLKHRKELIKKSFPGTYTFLHSIRKVLLSIKNIITLK